MNAKVGVYENHEKAVKALKSLDKHNYPMDKVSLMGKAEIIEDHIHVTSTDSTKNNLALLGVGAGVVAGIASGLGVFAIPGFGFLYGAGALIGAMGGIDVGLATGGLAYIMSAIGIKEDLHVALEKHMNEGRFVVVVHGNMDDVSKAEHILHTEGTHLSIE